MPLVKVIYEDGVTVIGASNLNDIQDAIIALEQVVGNIKNTAFLEYETVGEVAEPKDSE